MSVADLLSFKADDPFEYFLEQGTRRFAAREVRGVEGLSLVYRFELRFRIQKGDFPEPEELLGEQAALVISRSGIRLRRLVGIITETSLSATATGDPELVVVLEPKMAFLKHQSDYQVFRDRTVPQIVTDVLGRVGMAVELRLRDTYPVRPYTVMYGENLLDFVHRLLEDEGIFYFFGEAPDDAHSEESGATKKKKNPSVLVLGDGIDAYEPIDGVPTILLKSTASMARPDESLFDLRRVARTRPGKVALRDWNLEKPRLPMDVAAKLPKFDEDSFDGPEFYDYPGRYESPDLGQRRARLMAEAFACAASGVHARSDTARLMVGRTIDLQPDVPFAALGMEPEELVIVALEHDYRRAVEGSNEGQGTKLEVGVRAQSANVVYRPPRLTPSPIVTNPVIGHITGPEGEDIHCDEFGRVKVMFPWDRYQPKNDTCSHWVPVLQENTGTSTTVPRIGWEVVVAYVDGDPDRPYVLGRVYNGKDPFPEPLPQNKTKSALRSLSSPTRDGHNEIWFEDAAGRELVSLQAERDQNVRVANNKTEKVLNMEENSIVKDETIEIGQHNTVSVTKQQLLAIDGNQTIHVLGSRTRKVGKAEQSTVAGSRSVTIGGSHIRKIGGLDNVGGKVSHSEGVGGVEVEASLKKNSTNASLLQTLTVGGAVVEVAGQGKEEKSEMLRIETIGAKLVTQAKAGIEIKASVKRSTTVMAQLKATLGTSGKLASDDKLSGKVKGKAKANGSTAVSISVGGNKLIFEKDTISIETSSGNVEIVASGKSDLVSGEAQLK
jgi:type VI secretion system secreted protein VgrG